MAIVEKGKGRMKRFKKSGIKGWEWGCRKRRNKRRVEFTRPPKYEATKDNESKRWGIDSDASLWKDCLNMTGFG